MKLFFLLFTILSKNLYAGEECNLTRAYKDAKYDTYTTIKRPYEQCKNSMKEAYYWKAVAACKKDIDNNKPGTSCGQLVDNGTYPSDKIDISHCKAFKWDPSDIKKHLDNLVNSGSLTKCKD